jgi:hypothetical protein
METKLLVVIGGRGEISRPRWDGQPDRRELHVGLGSSDQDRIQLVLGRGAAMELTELLMAVVPEVR